MALSLSKELQRRGEDSNLRRQDYWRSGLLLLARCIKPLCHLSSRCLCYLLAALQKLPPMPPGSTVNQKRGRIASIHRESEKGSSRKPSFRYSGFSETGLSA